MKVKLVIGDWSRDGHNQYDELVYESSHSVKEIREAYKQSCRKLGLIFDCNIDHTGIEGMNWKHPEYNDRQICVDYEQNRISSLALSLLESHGIPTHQFYKEGYASVTSFSELMINIFKLSLPDLVMEEAAFKRSELKDITPINGWWCELNESWGIWTL